MTRDEFAKLPKEKQIKLMEKFAQVMCEYIDKSFVISSKAQFKKFEDMTEEEKQATIFINRLFGLKGD